MLERRLFRNTEANGWILAGDTAGKPPRELDKDLNLLLRDSRFVNVTSRCLLFTRIVFSTTFSHSTSMYKLLSPLICFFTSL